MPLHLLGKKSWNVYNPASIERVKRDEAEAERRAAEQEKRALQHEAEERVQFLKGGEQGRSASRGHLSADADAADKGNGAREAGAGVGLPRQRIQKRRLAGEDDTDRDIRIARETAQLTSSTGSTLKRQRLDNDDSAIVDAKGNISLIPVPQPEQQQAEAKKPLSEEDPFTVYLSHAAGKGKDSGKTPWYNSVPKSNVLSTGANDETDKDRWGDVSERRRQREAARMASDDPLAMMKSGVKQLREAERRRREWMEQRERDLREVEDLAAKEMRKRGRRKEPDEGNREKRLRKSRDGGHPHDDEDSLEGFNLDEGYSKPQDRDRDRDREESHHRSHHRRHHRDSHHHHHHRHRHHRRSP